jgi:hypothetical protein
MERGYYMSHSLLLGTIVGGIAVAGTAASLCGAEYLFSKTIPRQDSVQVDISEMADLAKWEEYKKIIHPRKEWLLSNSLEEIEIKSRDGLKLHGYYLPADKPSDRLVIGLHGYTSCGLSDFAAHSYFFHKQGFDCLIVDHRAHGKSEGDYVGFGILDRFDCLKWIEYIEKRFNGEKRILLHGTSMGATTALMTAGFADKLPESVKAVIADCAFTSPYDVFAHILKRDYHMGPFPVLTINEKLSQKRAGYGFKDYSTLTAVKETKLPILFIHGKEDKFVPTWMSQKNYEECCSPKELLLIENAGHGASYYENTEQYESAEIDFIDKWIPENSERNESENERI